MARQDEPVVVGRISGVYGVKGWVRVHSYTSPREALLDYPDWLIRGPAGWSDAGRREARTHGKGLVAQLKIAADRDEATHWVDADIGVRRDALEPTRRGEYYWADLEGLEVKSVSGHTLGSVAYLIETGANDVMVVKRDGGETLIPFVADDVVKEVDIDAGTVVVDWEWD